LWGVEGVAGAVLIGVVVEEISRVGVSRAGRGGQGVEGDGPVCVGVGWNIEGRRLSGSSPTPRYWFWGSGKGGRCEGTSQGRPLWEQATGAVGRARTSMGKGGHIWRRRDRSLE
jgi:hypothetical protein